MKSTASSPSRTDLHTQEPDSQETVATKSFDLPRAMEFLCDLDEFAVVAVPGVVIFFVIRGAVALAKEAFFSGDPPEDLGLGG